MAREIFTSRTKTKKFSRHVFPNEEPPFLRTGIMRKRKKAVRAKEYARLSVPNSVAPDLSFLSSE
ncbi:DUF1661 domain-containing protein [Porphyromonas gulae]|uniref:DUF1661 domain-containing protein n=1 Tax=Porphyromonas gulae TaxID=111105 RepID=UPI001F198638|nr:DUF1661 domain-containing protein [Porphyromonas gulae]